MTLTIGKTSNHLGQPTFEVTGNTGDLLRVLATTGKQIMLWLIIMKMTCNVTPVMAQELGIQNPALTFPESSRSFVEAICNSLQSSPTCNIV